MVNLSKGSAIVFLSTFVCAVSGQLPNGNAGNLFNGQKKIAEPQALNVNYPAEFGIPIELHTPDYSGPYDPIDPYGVQAAGRRQAKIVGAKSLDIVKSYIPPNLGNMMKKEAIKVALNEGRRFAFAHPKETAEIIGIATKAKALYDTAAHKVRAYENQAGGH